MTEKTLILVIGCHRSGTSAVAGCLSAMGVNFGDNLIPPAFDNPKGFFEDRRVVAMHDEIMGHLAASWDKPPRPNQWIPPGHRSSYIASLGSIILALDGPVCCIKDPRATLFVDLWREACDDLGVELKVLRVFREPEDVAASLQARNGMSGMDASKLVLHYDRAALEARPHATIRFPDDLVDGEEWWRVFCFEGLDLPIDPDTQALTSFFDPSLIHHGRTDDSPPWTVIVPSKSDEKILDFVANLLEAEPDILPDQIVVVSDGLSVETRQELADVTWVEGKQPFVYPRAINMGVEAAHPDSDLVIVGDDIRFVSKGAIDRLSRHSPGCAAVGAIIKGVCGQVAQHFSHPGDTAEWLTFNCIYIPRRVWDAVGPLDERFIGYGYDDVDWCLRAKDHGAMRIARDVGVHHLNESSYRSREGWEAEYEANRERFNDKWKEAMAPA